MDSRARWAPAVREVERNADEFAQNPEKGRNAGYRPEPGPPLYVEHSMGSLDDRPSIPGRDPYAAWLHGVARQDLRGCRYQIVENPEAPGGVEIVIL